MARRETHLPRKLVGLSPSDLKRMLNQWPTLPTDPSGAVSGLQVRGIQSVERRNASSNQF